MTTKVTIDAHAGWPVDVTAMANGKAVGPVKRVEPNTSEIFYVHSGQDLHVHEVQPGENSALPQSAEAPQPDRMLQFFAWQHLPAHLQEISRQFGELAQWMEKNLPMNPERTAGLRKLLEAKDCAVRARLFR